jgi:hypothetical protein
MPYIGISNPAESSYVSGTNLQVTVNADPTVQSMTVTIRDADGNQLVTGNAQQSFGPWTITFASVRPTPNDKRWDVVTAKGVDSTGAAFTDLVRTHIGP